MVYVEALIIILNMIVINILCKRYLEYSSFKKMLREREKEIELIVESLENTTLLTTNEMRNKIYEVSYLLLTLKTYYEKFIEYYGETNDSEKIAEFKVIIGNIDDQLKELGFKSKITSHKSLLEVTIFESSYSKN